MRISSKQRQQKAKSHGPTERATRSSSTPRSLRQSDLSVRRTETKKLKRDIADFKRQSKGLKRNTKFSVAGRRMREDASRSKDTMLSDDIGGHDVSYNEDRLPEDRISESGKLRYSGENGFTGRLLDEEEAEVASSRVKNLSSASHEGDTGKASRDVSLLSDSEGECTLENQDYCGFEKLAATVALKNDLIKGKRKRKRKRFVPKKKPKLASGSQGKLLENLVQHNAEGDLQNLSLLGKYAKSKRNRDQGDRAGMSIVKELQTSTGFVDKVDLGIQPEEMVPMKRTPRMASLNAIAKVNAVLESYSPMAGKTLNQIREKAQTRKADYGIRPKEDKRRKRSTSSVTQTDDILFFSSMKGDNNEWMLSGPSDVFKQSAVFYDNQPISDSRVSSTSNWTSEDESTTKDKAVQTMVNHKAVQTDILLLEDVTIANSPSSCTCGYLENISFRENGVSNQGTMMQEGWKGSDIPVTVYHTPPTVSTNTLNVPLCSSISTKTTTHTIAIPFTKTHLLAHTDMCEFQAFANQPINPPSSKRMASLNAIAMMNAMKVLDRPLFNYSAGQSSRTHDIAKFEKHNSSGIRVPKISFQATSTSRFSVGGKGKVINPIKAAQMKSLTNQLENIIEGKRQAVWQGNKIINGWVFEGEPVEKPVAFEDRIVIRRYYPCMRRNEEVINVRDAVLLKSGPRKKDLPFVARVAAIWEQDEGDLAGDMMISVFWYYRPEQTEVGKLQGYHGELEVLASRHRDDNSAACVVDKCYVLSYPQYCRFRAKNKLYRESRRAPLSPVPPTESTRPGITPLANTDPNLVFFCRHAYDSRTGKILKNPFY